MNGKINLWKQEKVRERKKKRNLERKKGRKEERKDILNWETEDRMIQSIVSKTAAARKRPILLRGSLRNLHLCTTPCRVGRYVCTSVTNTYEFWPFFCITAPAQESATILPCIRPCYHPRRVSKNGWRQKWRNHWSWKRSLKTPRHVKQNQPYLILLHAIKTTLNTTIEKDMS